MSEDTKASQSTESYEFKAEIRQLLNILVHSLYTEREIFMRELISNASDALHRLQFEALTNQDILDPDAELAITLEVDEEARTITIADTGIGMTAKEVARDLGTIAHSGAAAFLEQLEKEQRPSVELIGQFGVGFYSVFMVAEQVRVLSRSYRPDAEGIEWVSDGSAQYSLGPADKADRGTRIEIKLKEDAAEFANTWRLEQIIRKHSDFVAFPIYVGDKDEAVNRKLALWRQSPREVTDEQYEEFYKHLTFDYESPLLHAHLVSDAPVDVRSVLYVPSRRERGVFGPSTDHGLRLYIRNVLIQEHNTDLLPNHFRFVEGVVESEDLPLNISREVVQRSPSARRVQKALGRKLTRELQTLAEEKPEDYSTFWQEFGPFLKEGVASDTSAKEDLLPLLMFHSSKSGEDLISLAQYAERMAENQEAVYYVQGEDLRSVAHSPHLDYFRSHDIEVIFLVEPIDGFMIAALKEYDGKPLRNVDDAALDLPQADESKDEAPESIAEPEFNRLISRIVTVLDDRVLEVRESNVLTESPCRLAAADDGPMNEMSRVYRMLGQEVELPKRILEINRRHPIIGNLAQLVNQRPEAEVIDPAIEQLFENQLLMEGLHPNPTEMIPRIQQLMESATATRET